MRAIEGAKRCASIDAGVKGSMRYVLILIVFFLTSCNELSSIDKKLIGKWVWSEKDGDSEVSGFLNLLADHSYSYELNWAVRVERIVETFSDPNKLARWYTKNGSICLDSSDVQEDKCFWKYKISKSGAAFVFYDKNGMNKPIAANKQ